MDRVQRAGRFLGSALSRTGPSYWAANSMGARITVFGSAGPPVEIHSVSMSAFGVDLSYLGWARVA